MRPDHISISQMRMLQRCGQQYQYRYIEGLKLPPGLALLRGSAVDDSVTVNLRQKMTTHRDMDVDEAKQWAEESLKSRMEQGYVIDGHYSELDEKKAIGLAKDETTDLAGLHAEEIAPLIEPVDTQVRLEVPLIGDITFLGIVDVIAEDGVHDTKTASKKPPGDEADKSDQLTVYDWLERQIHGEAPQTLTLDYLVRRASGSMDKYVLQAPARTQEELNTFETRALRSLNVIEHELFLPAAEDAWCCNAKWCGYHRDAGGPCPFSRGKKRPTT